MKRQTSAVFQGARLLTTSYSSPPGANDTASQRGGSAPALCHQSGPSLCPAGRGSSEEAATVGSFIMEEQLWRHLRASSAKGPSHLWGEAVWLARVFLRWSVVNRIFWNLAQLLTPEGQPEERRWSEKENNLFVFEHLTLQISISGSVYQTDGSYVSAPLTNLWQLKRSSLIREELWCVSSPAGWTPPSWCHY